MHALIIEGDTVEPTRRALSARGYDKVEHWPGRKSSDLRRPLPRGVDLYVIVLNYVNHNLAHRIRVAARRQAQPVEFVGRKHGPERQPGAQPALSQQSF